MFLLKILLAGKEKMPRRYLRKICSDCENIKPNPILIHIQETMLSVI